MSCIVNYKKFTSRRRFGVETEIDCYPKAKIKSFLNKKSFYPSCIAKYQLSGDNDYWHIKDDATCGSLGRSGPKGVEIASFIGQGYEDLQHISTVIESVSEIGCKVNDNCGLHIHADATDLSLFHLEKILAYWVKVENTIAMALPSRRLQSIYCVPYSKKINEYDFSLECSSGIFGFFKPKITYFNNNDRRVNLNIVNYVRAEHYQTNFRKTLELRWPEGTLSSVDIKCWVRLFLNFIDTCKYLPMPKDLKPFSLMESLVCFGLGDPMSLCESSKNVFVILSKGLYDTKKWFLERIIKHASFVPNFSFDFYFQTLREAEKELVFITQPVP